eukprot:gene4299-5294_t
MREVLSTEHLAALGVSLAHPALPPGLLRSALGVSELGVTHLLDALRAACTASPPVGPAHTNPPPQDLGWVARVLALLGSPVCSNGSGVGSVLSEAALVALRTLPVLPLSDGTWAAPEPGPVFFALPGASMLTAAWQTLSEEAMPVTLHPDFVAAAESLPDGSDVKKGIARWSDRLVDVLQQLGVRQLQIAVVLQFRGQKGTLLQVPDVVELCVIPGFQSHAAFLSAAAGGAGHDAAGAGAAALSTPQLVWYLAILRLHCANLSPSSSAALLERLRPTLVLSTSRGPQLLLPPEPLALAADGEGGPGGHTANLHCTIHFTPAYGSPLDPDLFASAGWTYLDEAYLEVGGQERAAALPGNSKTSRPSRARDPGGGSERRDWRVFFEHLGVVDLAHVTRRRIHVGSLEDESAPHEAPWAAVVREFSPALTGGEDAVDGVARQWEVLDWQCSELEGLLHVLTPAGCTAVAAYLDHHWTEHFAQFAVAEVQTVEGESPGTEGGAEGREEEEVKGSMCWSAPSTFAGTLRNTAWVADQQGRLRRPGELFVPTRAVTQVLGEAGSLEVVPTTCPLRFADPGGDPGARGGWIPRSNITACMELYISSSGLLECMGAQPGLSVKKVLCALRRWSQQKVFAGRTVEMARVYTYLSRSMEEEPEHITHVAATFSAHPCVFLPDKVGGAGEEAGGGRFHHLEHLRLLDNTHIVEGLPEGRCPLRIIAKAVAAEGEPYTTEQLNHVIAVFTMWSEGIARGVITMEEQSMWRTVIEQLRVFPTTKQTWASLKDGVYINDDTELAEHFAARADVCFVQGDDWDGTWMHQVPASAQNRDPRRRYYPQRTIREFLLACGVPLLSRCVSREVITYGSHFGTQLDRLVRSVLPAVQRWLRSHSLEEYEQAAPHVARELPHFRLSIVDELYVVYRLAGLAPGLEETRVEAAAIMEGAHLHVRLLDAHDYNTVFLEFSRLVGQGSVQTELATFACAVILTEISNQDKETLLLRQGCEPLPETEPEWVVPGPTTILSTVDQDFHSSPADDASDHEVRLHASPCEGWCPRVCLDRVPLGTIPW